MERMNKKGWAEALILMVVIGVIAIVFFGGWIYASGLFKDSLNAIPGEDASSNVTAAARASYNYLDTGLKNGLPLVALVLIVGFALATLIMAVFSAEHPALIFVYVVLIILLFIFSVYISNAYENSILNDSVLGATFSTFTAANFIISYMPMWVAVIGFFGIVFMIAGRYLI